MTGEETAKLCAKYAEDKKAEDIVILDVRGISPITDYFVIGTASSSPHLRAVQREILHGRNAVGGEWGHNPMPWPESGEWPGESCYCGRTGCIETFLSGPGLARDYKQATGQPAEPVEIVGRAGAGEREAVSCLDRYVNRLARALATIINVIDPDAIVLGGGLSSIERLYRDVPAQWSRYVFSDRVTTELLSPKFGDSSGVRGAAWLWPEKA